MAKGLLIILLSLLVLGLWYMPDETKHMVGVTGAHSKEIAKASYKVGKTVFSEVAKNENIRSSITENFPNITKVS